MLDGSRTFEIVWGAVAGTLCVALGALVVADWLRVRHTAAPSIFGRRLDPGRGLELAYGIFTLAMGGTNYGCRFIDHAYLRGVHEGYFALTLAVVALVAPGYLLRGRARRTLDAR